MRLRAWLVAAVTIVTVVWMSPMPSVSARSASGIVISEYRFRGPLGANDEFVELFNAGSAPVNVSGWLIRASNNLANPSFATRVTIPADTIMPPGCFYLITNTNPTLPYAAYSGTVPGNSTYAIGFADDGGVALTTRLASEIVDQVGQGTTPLAYGEGQRLPMVMTNVNRGIERRPGGDNGHDDTDDNFTDFQEINPATPRNAQSQCLTPGNIAITAAASAASVEQGQPLAVFGTVSPGTLPASSGISVTGDLSSLGGSAATSFADNGVAPDVVAGDRVFSAEVFVPHANPIGARSITLTATDAQARTASNTIAVNVTLPALMYLPHEIQGTGAMSPLPLGTPVVARGVVTGRKANGFFLQTEAGMEDADPNTSEGLFVLASGAHLATAQPGHTITVNAVVAELVPTVDTASPSFTALQGVTSVFDIGAGSLPAAAPLTSVEVSAAGSLDQLERFEGMRVHVASLMAVNGSSSDGAFYAVLTGEARPFRTEGVESGYPVLPCAVGPCNVPLFDGNPERLRVDSGGLVGVAAGEVRTAAVMTDVTGPLDFQLRTFTIVPEAALVPVGGMSPSAAPAAAGDQFTVASFVLGGAVDQDRLAKASLAIRNHLNMPDIVGVQEVDGLAALTALAQAIDDDAAADGQTAPQYQAQLVEGSDPAGLDVGVLVKTAGARVVAMPAETVGADRTFVDPADGTEYPLYERAPLLVRATVTGPATELPQDVTVIVTHLRSAAGSDLDDASGALVREQRNAQAEFLADYIDGLQDGEAIVALGDYNAFSFSDGYVDVVGAVAGNPAAPDQVTVASADLVSPDLVNVSDLMPAAERYSSVSNGTAQALDHVLATANLASQFAGVVRPRINADFPAGLAADPASPSRLSDRDPVVAYFSFPADVEAPTFVNVPADHTAEAAGPDGAVVSYEAPSATDNLDTAVVVACSPVSGSLFPLGNTGVTCSAQDAAGNPAEASFTVSVVDTTAPVLTVPGDITGEATSADGRVVSFTATATDAVTTSPAVDCTPASGSTFAVGDTVVTCAAADAAGNVATGTFTVTVTSTSAPPVFGHIAGVGAVVEGDERVWFAFDVRETSALERGWVQVRVRGGGGRPDRYLAAGVTGVQMSNSPDYTPSRYARTGIDTVSFSGTGWWNGAAGHRFEITASDRGEPGRGRDTFSLTIFAPDGTVVESVSGVLRDGNIQSLR
jgi:predicted extracellular nuclease